MGTVWNLLFIMCDQLRADYLSCNGYPTLTTPHIDALAARGVNFTRAYCQSPVCGPSRMSFYTGRYMFSHGATWNNVPLSVGAWTMGDYLRARGYNSENPWEDFANSVEGPNGEVLSGWYMRHAHLPARVAEEDSETAYMTNHAMEYIRTAGDHP